MGWHGSPGAGPEGQPGPMEDAASSRKGHVPASGAQPPCPCVCVSETREPCTEEAVFLSPWGVGGLRRGVQVPWSLVPRAAQAVLRRKHGRAGIGALLMPAPAGKRAGGRGAVWLVAATVYEEALWVLRQLHL